jgi:hypothetical protein
MSCIPYAIEAFTSTKDSRLTVWALRKGAFLWKANKEAVRSTCQWALLQRVIYSFPDKFSTYIFDIILITWMMFLYVWNYFCWKHHTQVRVYSWRSGAFDWQKNVHHSSVVWTQHLAWPAHVVVIEKLRTRSSPDYHHQEIQSIYFQFNASSIRHSAIQFNLKLWVLLFLLEKNAF